MVLDLSMLLTMMPVSALAGNEEPATSGSCDANVAWNFEEDTLTICGVGEMDNYGNNRGEWYHLRDI